MKMIRSPNFSGIVGTNGHFVLNLFENLQCSMLGKHSARTQLVLHRSQQTLCTHWTVGNVETDLSTFPWPLDVPPSFPDEELSPNRRVLLLLTT